MANEIMNQALTPDNLESEQKITYTPTPQAILHIGKKGRNIKAITDKHNVKIKIEENTIIIKGRKAAEATRQIRDIDQQTAEITDTDSTTSMHTL